jgi:chromosome partitioning protein
MQQKRYAPMSILMFLNLKGGVAKTTSAVAVAECLADAGHRVLVIDADHQCMSGELLIGESRQLKCETKKITLHDMLAAMLEEDFVSDQVSNYVVDQVSDIGGGLSNLSLIPCSVRIDDFATNMAKARRGYQSTDEFNQVLGKRRNHVRQYLRDNYDFTIIDCPPSIALQVKLFLTIADYYIIPCVPDRLSVRGSLHLLDRIRRLGLSKIKPLGTLWSLYRDQNSMHSRIIEAVEKKTAPYDSLPQPFATIIPNATAIAQATEPNQSHTSFTVKYSSKFGKLFRSLCDEIVQRSVWSAESVTKKILAR